MKPRAIGAVVVAVTMTAVGFLPLFGGPGYEQSLATGLVVPPAAAIAVAVEVGRGETKTPLHSVGRGVATGLAYAGISLATALVHAARVGICELWGAVLYFFLTAAMGAIVGGAWGAIAGEIVHRGVKRRVRSAATLLALAGPLGGVLVSLYRYQTSPMIFAFDPFVGYFSGASYDTVIDAGGALLTYRLGTLATLVAIVLFGSILERAGRAFVLDVRTTETRTRAALGLLAGACSIAVTLSGTKLGHYSTTESIVADLGATQHGPRCDVVYPSTTRLQEANLLLQDCEEELAAVEKRLEARGPERVRAFFFRDEADKKRLMGAAGTYIAKPWRHEVYLQMAPYPHPILGHELAHVVAGSFGRGPFRVAGALGGWFPNPGLIEGTAVAASPDDEDLTDAQWARAMMQIGLLPKMEQLFALRGFFGSASAKSYTLAGAFIAWIGDTRGMAAVQRWYGGADVALATGKTWPELDVLFRDWLKTVPLPPEAESFAKAKFAPPGLFGRRCPHVVDALRHDADICRDTQRFEQAIALYDRVLAKDPTDHASLQSRATTERRHGDREEGRQALERIATGADVPRTWRDRAEEALADADFIDGKVDAARPRYDALAARSLDEDQARTFEVKSIATQDPAAREAIGAFLFGDEKHGPDPVVTAIALGRWHTPLASYLLARTVLPRGFYEAAGAALDDALADALPTRRLAREAIRQRAVVACALSDRDALERLRARVEGPEDPFVGASGGRRAATLRLIGRCSRR